MLHISETRAREDGILGIQNVSTIEKINRLGKTTENIAGHLSLETIFAHMTLQNRMEMNRSKPISPEISAKKLTTAMVTIIPNKTVYRTCCLGVIARKRTPVLKQVRDKEGRLD